MPQPKKSKYTKAAIATWFEKYNALPAAIDAKAKEMESLQPGLNKARAELAVIQQQIEPLATKMDAIRSQRQRLDNLKLLVLWQENLDEHRNAYDQLSSQLDGINQQIKDVTKEFNAWTTIVVIKNSQQNLAANQKSLVALNEQVSALAKQISSLTTEINLVQGTINALAPVVSALEAEQHADQHHHHQHSHHQHEEKQELLAEKLLDATAVVVHAINDGVRDSDLEAKRATLQTAQTQLRILTSNRNAFQVEMEGLVRKYHLLKTDIAGDERSLGHYSYAEQQEAMNTDANLANSKRAACEATHGTLVVKQNSVKASMQLHQTGIREQTKRIRELNSSNRNLELAAGEYSTQTDIAALDLAFAPLQEARKPFDLQCALKQAEIATMNGEVNELGIAIDDLENQKSRREREPFLFPFCNNPKKLLETLTAELKALMTKFNFDYPARQSVEERIAQATLNADLDVINDFTNAANIGNTDYQLRIFALNGVLMKAKSSIANAQDSKLAAVIGKFADKFVLDDKQSKFFSDQDNFKVSESALQKVESEKYQQKKAALKKFISELRTDVPEVRTLAATGKQLIAEIEIAERDKKVCFDTKYYTLLLMAALQLMKKPRDNKLNERFNHVVEEGDLSSSRSLASKAAIVALALCGAIAVAAGVAGVLLRDDKAERIGSYGLAASGGAMLVSALGLFCCGPRSGVGVRATQITNQLEEIPRYVALSPATPESGQLSVVVEQGDERQITAAGEEQERSDSRRKLR